MTAEENNMRLNCPRCGSEDIRRAHRRPIEKLFSFVGRFPFLCVECGVRFLAWAGRDELRKRWLLRALAAQEHAWLATHPAPEPPVLITVRTPHQTEDLLRLLRQINAAGDATSEAAGAAPSPLPTVARAGRDPLGPGR